MKLLLLRSFYYPTGHTSFSDLTIGHLEKDSNELSYNRTSTADGPAVILQSTIYDYVYAIKQGVDSTIYYEASSTQVSLYRPFLNRPLYQPALETGGRI